jgi:hypothetical protein
MTWTLDGSGLLVKRHRGMTLPQWTTNGGVVRGDMMGKRVARRSANSGRTSNADSFRACVKDHRAYRRERRAKRHAKAAARRMRAILSRVLINIGHAPFYVLPSGVEIRFHTFDSPGGPVALFDQVCEKSDAATRKAIGGHALPIPNLGPINPERLDP